MAPPATITVFDNLYDTAGHALANATVTCILNGVQETTAGGLIVPLQQMVTTDPAGRFAFTVVCNDLLSPANSTYTILTPMRSYDIAPQSANGSSQQTTAANVIVNTPTPLAPSTSNITGNLTIAGTLTVSGLVTAQAGLTVSGGTFSIPAGGFSMAGPLTLTASSSKIVPGATSLSIRDTGDANDNLLVSNAGNVTARGSLTVTTGPLNVSAGGASITGNSTVTGTLTVTSTLTVSAGGVAVTGNSTITGTLTATGLMTAQAALTVSSGNLNITAGNLVFAAASAKIIPGATQLSWRNNADGADNLVITDAGLATMRNALSIPPSAGGTLAGTSYGTVPVKIAENLLGAAVATVTFSSIPSGFRHLMLSIYARGDTAATTINARLTFNNDAGGNYEDQFLQGAGATASANEALGQAFIRIGNLPAASATANYFGHIDAKILQYAGAVGNKLVSASNIEASANTTGTLVHGLFGGKWRTTATAINRLDIAASVGNFIIGSLFTLWGLP